MLSLSTLSAASSPVLRRGASSTKVGPMNAVTLFGVLAVSFMMVMYALEQRRPIFFLPFALGCLLSRASAFFSEAWPFGWSRLSGSVLPLRAYLTAGRGRLAAR